MLILSHKIFTNIKNYSSPEYISQLFFSESTPSENLLIYIKYFQNKIIKNINEDFILYFFIAYLLENKLQITIQNELFNFPNINKNNNYDKEAFEILSNHTHYLPLFFEMLISFSPSKIIDLLIPNLSCNTSFLSIIQPDILSSSLKVVSKSNRMRRINLLTEMLKIILTNNYNKILIDIIIECYHDLAVNFSFKNEYYYEINDIIEWAVLGPTLFEKLVSLHSNQNDLYFLNNYTKECERLCNEFERVLRHPTLSEESQIFYNNEIQRLVKIRKIIFNKINRINLLKIIKEKNAALTIQNAWYNHITKICNPNHPYMQKKFMNLLEKNDIFMVKK